MPKFNVHIDHTFNVIFYLAGNDFMDTMNEHTHVSDFASPYKKGRHRDECLIDELALGGKLGYTLVMFPY